MDALFNSIERSKVQGYHDFMQGIILEAILHIISPLMN